LQPYTVLAGADWVLTGHVESGKVGLFDVADHRPPTLVRLLDAFPTGTNGLARHPVTGAYYLVSRDSDRIYPFFVASTPRQAGEGPAVTSGPSIRIRSNGSGNDSRSLVFAPPRGDLPGGELAFVTNRQPPSVVVVDTAVGADGVAAGEVIDVIGLSTGPSRLAVQPLPGDRYLVMAICFDTERLFYIDPELRAVTDVLVTGGGPHAVVADPDRRRAYLANFGESTVWVLDLDPASRHFRDVVLSIGIPERPSSND
jgi:DNA-binding beta-propeller fold protein YncE